MSALPNIKWGSVTFSDKTGFLHILSPRDTIIGLTVLTQSRGGGVREKSRKDNWNSVECHVCGVYLSNQLVI